MGQDVGYRGEVLASIASVRDKVGEKMERGWGLAGKNAGV